MTWITAPSGLYTLHNGKAVPVLAVDERGRGLLPGGRQTTDIYVHLNGWTPSTPTRTFREIVRDNDGGECPHGDPRGERYCALCRRVESRNVGPISVRKIQ